MGKKGFICLIFAVHHLRKSGRELKAAGQRRNDEGVPLAGLPLLDWGSPTSVKTSSQTGSQANLIKAAVQLRLSGDPRLSTVNADIAIFTNIGQRGSSSIACSFVINHVWFSLS